MSRSNRSRRPRPPYIYRLIRSMGYDPEEVLAESTKTRLGYKRQLTSRDEQHSHKAESPAQPRLTDDADSRTSSS
jgi:hypothetical protein